MATPDMQLHYLEFLEKWDSTLRKKNILNMFLNHTTPNDIGIKWQLDVKYVPKECYSGTDKEKFYQYTVIDEASRERFIYPYKEQSSYSTVYFIKRSIIYFGYKPKTIQTIMVLNLLIQRILKEFILLMFYAMSLKSNTN